MTASSIYAVEGNGQEDNGDDDDDRPSSTKQLSFCLLSFGWVNIIITKESTLLNLFLVVTE